MSGIRWTAIPLILAALGSQACDDQHIYPVWADEGGKVRIGDTCDAWQAGGKMQTDCPIHNVQVSPVFLSPEKETVPVLNVDVFDPNSNYTTLRAEAIPNPGYKFDGWVGCNAHWTEYKWDDTNKLSLSADGRTCIITEATGLTQTIHYTLADSEQTATVVAKFSEL